MIISFDPEIFQSQDHEIRKTLAKILIAFTEKDHFISLESIESIFFDDEYNYTFAENIIAQNYLSKEDRENLEGYIWNNREEISQVLADHLTHFTIGTDFDSGEIHPKDAYRIINERSLIVIENGTNDGKFIQGIIDKYKDFGNRKSIYQLLKKVLDDEYLSYDHAGGIGSIKAQLKGRVEGIYRQIHKFKLLVIFDSDKTHPSDFNQLNKNLIKYLKQRSISDPVTDQDISYNDNDLVIWHILYKRSIENYVPVEVIIRNISNLDETQKYNLRSLSAEEMDFIQYYKPQKYYISIGKDKVKDQFPEMFLTDFLPRELEDRCSHHQVSITLPNGTIEQVSEIEQILLKIAKII